MEAGGCKKQCGAAQPARNSGAAQHKTCRALPAGRQTLHAREPAALPLTHCIGNSPAGAHQHHRHLVLQAVRLAPCAQADGAAHRVVQVDLHRWVGGSASLHSLA